MSRAVVTLGWLLTRGFTLVLLFAFEGTRGVAGDLTYFADSLRAVSDHGLSQTLGEYPLPAVAVVGVPWGLGAVLGSTEACFTIREAPALRPGRAPRCRRRECW